MSDEARAFFIRISGKNQVVNFRGIVSDYPNLKGFNGFVKNLAKDRNLNYTLLKGAIYLEIAEQSEINQIYKKIFSANNQLADWLKGGIEAIEKWKFTEENYDYEKHFLNIRNSNPVNPNSYQSYTYKPILPIPAFMTYSDSITGNNRQNIVDKGLSKLSGFVESFEEISTAVVYNIVKATPDITDDIFFAIVFYVKNLIEDYIPESIKNVYNKLKIIFKQILGSVKQIANFIKEKVGIELAKMNAFLCGILNGLISLGQLIILLLAMVVDNIPFLENEKTSLVELAKHQEKLEFIEDFVDLFAEKSTKILEGITSLFSDSKIWKEVSAFLSGLKKKFLSLNEYFWAYFLGAVVFELILDAVIAYFTGGSSLVAELSAKISRVVKQAEQLGAKGLNLSKNLGKKVATTADDLLKWLRKEFEELVEAIKGGEFSKYLKNKFSKLLGESVVKLEQYEVRILVRKATQNGSSKKVMLGKYIREPLEESYNYRAGKDHTFFEMKGDLWKDVVSKTNNDKEEIWKINKEFIDQQAKANKEFFLSHDPYNLEYYNGFYQKEIDYLTKDLKFSIEKVEENLWKVKK